MLNLCLHQQVSPDPADCCKRGPWDSDPGPLLMLLVRFNIKINQETTRQSPEGGSIQPRGEGGGG